MNGIKYLAASILFYWFVKDDYPRIWWFLNNPIKLFPGKILDLILFSEMVNWQSAHIRNVYVINNRHSLFQGKDFKAKTCGLLQELASLKHSRYTYFTIQELICTHLVLSKKAGIFFLTTAWNDHIFWTTHFWKTDIYQNVTRTTWDWNAGKLRFACEFSFYLLLVVVVLSEPL